MVRTIDSEQIVSELQSLLSFGVIDEVWIVGSFVDESSSFGSGSDVDVICKSSVIAGVRDEFMSPECESAQSLLVDAESVWGEASEGVELEWTLPVVVDGETFEAQVHLIPQPVSYDVGCISGAAVRVYPSEKVL